MDFWPSSRVSQGGIFHPRKVTYSKETHDLIKLLMEEQKMSIFQRNKVEYYLRTGTPLPMELCPSPKSATNHKSCTSAYVRGRTARRRTLESIQASGAFEHDKFVPDQPARESFDKQKIRLQEKMSGLKYFDELNGNHCKSSLFKLDKSEDCSDMDPIDTLLKEIQERADWIKEMEELGEGKKHRLTIRAEIAERLNQIKKLEKLHQHKSKPQNI